MAAAIKSSFSSSSRVNVVQGPPGTGKTTVISAIVAEGLSRNQNFFVTAQSNTATKNLVDALVKRGIEDIVVVVSDDFYVEWHEHRYTDIIGKVTLLKTSSLDKEGFDSRLLNSSVVLATLAQLSTFKVSSAIIKRGLGHLIIDEASQICEYFYPHLFEMYHKSLDRVTFVGDQEQLAPSGSDTIKGIHSIFNRLKVDAFLTESYRLPFEICVEISKTVYNGKLFPAKAKSNLLSPLVLVDAGGEEARRQGSFSYKVT
jgi:regulator of nonsense transcripts 1